MRKLHQPKKSVRNMKCHIANSVLGLAALCTLLSGCASTTNTITLQIQPDQGGGWVTVNGTGFTPGTHAKISYINIPRRPLVVQAGGPVSITNPDGTFTYSERFDFTSQSQNYSNQTVLVVAIDKQLGATSAGTNAAPIWVP